MNRVFLIPSETLGRVEDVHPEQLVSSGNDWVAHNRRILAKKRAAKFAVPDERLTSSDAAKCPAMADLDSVGLILKWPATAILREIQPKGWEIKPSTNYNFFRYTGLTSFAETGEAEAILVETGFTVVTPPGWSVLVKNLPNTLGPKDMTFAEGIVRADQATWPLKVHAFLHGGKQGSGESPGGARTRANEIRVKRGDPMVAIFAFRREEIAYEVVTDPALMKEAARLAEVDRQTFENAPGGYKRLYVDDSNPSSLYPELLKRP